LHPAQPEDPLAHYREKAAGLLAAFGAAVRRVRQFQVCLVILGSALFAGFILTRTHPSIPLWPLVPVLALASLAVLGLRNASARSAALYRLRGYYETGIARLTYDWDSLPPGEEYLEPRHLYAADLNLFGRGSLYQLLSSARTRAGRDTLARWMKEPASIEEARARAAAVRELWSRVDLRDALAAAGPSKSADFSLETFREWVQSAPPDFPAWAPWAALLLGSAVLLVAGACLVQWSLQLLANPYVAALLGLEAGFSLLFFHRVRAVLKSLRVPSAELPVACNVVRILEERRFTAPKLVSLSECLRFGHASASRELGRLMRLVTLLGARDNAMFMLPSYFLLWGTQFAMAICRWRRVHGARLLAWLEAVGEFEALVCLATYACEHPRDPFPEFCEGGPLFEGQGIGHPLLDEAVCVRNDFQLGNSPRFVVVSGSNMSGKSTFLRAVALNAVLARMGAPVCCARLKLSNLQVGASILVHDSLADGRSHFFAELDRLRQLIDAAGRAPLLYVVDEILIGTNSRDRRIATEWVIRALAARGAVGLISTHDLALSEIVDAPGFDGRNLHFADTGDPSGLSFDYRLRSGVVERSNALNIVRHLGIEIVDAPLSAETSKSPPPPPLPPPGTPACSPL
jgi:hypothetical protein